VSPELGSGGFGGVIRNPPGPTASACCITDSHYRGGKPCNK
jgi:hypothetical protein